MSDPDTTVPADHHEPARGDEVRGDWEHAWMVLTRERDEAVATLEALRAKRGGVADERERYITELEAGAAEVRAALGARDDETTLDAARRAVRDRDEAVGSAEAARGEAQQLVDAIGDAAIAAGVGDVLADGRPHTADEIAIARVETMRAETVCLRGQAENLEHNFHAACAEADTLRLYLARALREVDPKLRRNIEADLRAEGVTPPGVLVSAEEAAKVRGVLLEAEADYELEPVVKAWIAAGRPLASEEE